MGNREPTDECSIERNVNDESHNPHAPHNDDDETHPIGYRKHKFKKTNKLTITRVGIGSGASETVRRYGSASAEFIKAYRGIDHETGRKFSRSLKGISEYKKSEKYETQNIKQHAGFSAETQSAAQKNANNIINGDTVRVVLTGDIKEFGANHPIIDLVSVDANGAVISGSGSQMKFVNDYQTLLKNIATGKGGGKNDLSRYLDVKLELPSEQVEAAINICKERAESLRKQADALMARGNTAEAEKKLAQANNYDKIRGNIRDSGLTTNQAIFLTKHPKLGTCYSIARTSHRAGVQGAKIGAAIGGVISILSNGVAVCNDNKELGDAILDAAIGTGKAAAVGYGTAFVGSAVKGVMQQSSNAVVRSWSKTSLPAMIVTVCLELGGAVRSYMNGEIDEVEFFETIGEKGTNLLSSGLFTTIGQIVIPIPIAGAAIGGIIGYMLSSLLYQDTLAAFKDAEEARDNYLRTKYACEAAREHMETYRQKFRTHFVEWLDEGRAEIAHCMSMMDAATLNGNSDEFAASANVLATLMGKRLQFSNRDEFDAFMSTDAELVL